MVLESKYNIGDSLWFIDNNKIKNLKIEGIRIDYNKIYRHFRESYEKEVKYTFSDDEGHYSKNIGYCERSYYLKYEDELFETKENLLKTL